MPHAELVLRLFFNSASKFAADGFSQALSADLHRMKKTGINITTVYPKFVDTKLVTDLANRIEMRDRLAGCSPHNTFMASIWL